MPHASANATCVCIYIYIYALVFRIASPEAGNSTHPHSHLDPAGTIQFRLLIVSQAPEHKSNRDKTLVEFLV